MSTVVPAKLSPQLATLVDSPPKGSGWIYEVKFDGYRILARCEGKGTRLYTRNENDWTAKMESLAREVTRLRVGASAWLDGEVVVLDEHGVPNFNALQNAFDEVRTETITYFIFDAPFLDGKDMRGLALKDRRAALERLFADFDSDRVRLSRIFDSDGDSVLKSACKMGLEGVIAKRLNAPYRSARTHAWLKIKCQRRQEFVVGGFTPRTDSPHSIGSLLLGVYDDEGRLRYAGSVGTGWTTKLAGEIFKKLEKLEIDASPFDPVFAPRKGRWSRRAAGGERWVRPSVVVEVTFGEWTPDGSIRHASFKGIRMDKSAKAVRRE